MVRAHVMSWCTMAIRRVMIPCPHMDPNLLPVVSKLLLPPPLFQELFNNAHLPRWTLPTGTCHRCPFNLHMSHVLVLGVMT
jgi:hypothetical protein